MAAPETLTVPGGTSFRLVESAVSSAGKRVEFEVTMPPDALSPPKHFHPHQEETWTVIEGELSVLVDRDWRNLGAGESLSIAPGTVHTVRNPSSEPVRFRTVHSPALDFQDYIEALHDATAAPNTRLAKLLRGAIVLTEYRSTQLSASRTRRIAETVIAAVGRALR
jgi:quercetin dioxygenase-like cupin family protein